MLSKINVRKIVEDHLQTLRNADTKRLNKGDYILFFIIPIVSALFLVLYFKFMLSESLVNILITCLSIFVGLLLNLLVIVFDIISKVDNAIEAQRLKKNFLKEIYANISFCILISLLNIGFLVITLSHHNYIKIAGNILADTILFMFGLTLLMVLKRVHILLSKEF